MEKEKLLKAIHGHLEDIQEQFEIIRNYEGKIPGIEIDLLMENIRHIYGAFLQLQKINQPVTPSRPEKKKIVPEEVPAEQVSDIVENEPVPEVEETEVQEAVYFEVPVSPAEKQEEEEAQVEDDPTGEETQKAKTTLDLFGEQSSTLADRLKDPSETRVADKLQHDKVKDIRGVIGINEKFLFINELFDGSQKNYEKAIGRLNECESSEQAGMFLTELQETYMWDAEAETSKTFIDLVNRKF